MKQRPDHPSYLSTLLKKYGLQAPAIAKATGVTRQAALHWLSGRSWPVSLQIPSVVLLLKKYEPSLTADALLARENAAYKRKPGPRPRARPRPRSRARRTG